MATNRRSFLKQSSASIAGASLLTAPMRAAGANDRLRLAVLGCGGQGRQGHIAGLRGLANHNIELVAVCDPDRKRVADAAKESGAKPFGDLRRILDDATIDGVTIATPDHWHTPAAIMAMEAGKHVYVEKPCSHNVREGRLLVETSKRTKRVVQHGTQARSSRGWQEAMGMLHDGIIGDVLIAKAWNIQRRSNIGHHRPSDAPAGFDYDMWTGPAPAVPFQANRHHYSWHWWYNFGTGDLGNDGVHEFDMARWGLGVDGHPTSVAVAGGKFYFDDDQEFPDTVSATFQYPGDGSVGAARQLVFEMRIWCTNYPYNVDGGVEFWGTKGKMFISRRGKFQLLGERNKKRDDGPSEDPSMPVQQNLLTFAKAVREQAAATADANIAHHSATLCHLANIGVRVGRSFQFDPQTEQIVGDAEANGLLRRSYREDHFAVPKGI